MRTAIIGAGISGLYLGQKLSQKGSEVVIYEQKEKITERVCSGLFSQRILDFIPESKNLIQNKIDFCLIHFSKKTIQVNFSKSFFVMDHTELDKLATGLAEKCGVKIIFNSNIISAPTGFDRVIGCDGANSAIRKSLGLQEPKMRLGIQGFVNEISSAEFVEVWPIKNGFIWKIPRKNDIEYGVIGDIAGCKKAFDEFLIKNDIVLQNVKSKIIPQGLILPKNNTTTLCGDSAGLTKPWSGGGVIWGLKAGNFLQETFPNFSAYRKKTRRFFLPKIIFSKIAIKIVYFLGFNIPWLLPKQATIESDYLT